MVKYCCVPFCGSNYYRQRRNWNGTRISLHEFPSDLRMRYQWLRIIQKLEPKTRLPWTPTEYSAVCSRHFTQDQFKKNLKRTILKRDAIPTIFPDYPAYLQKAIKKRCELVKQAIQHDSKEVSCIREKQRKHSQTRPLILKYGRNTTNHNSFDELPAAELFTQNNNVSDHDFENDESNKFPKSSVPHDDGDDDDDDIKSDFSALVQTSDHRLESEAENSDSMSDSNVQQHQLICENKTTSDKELLIAASAKIQLLQEQVKQLEIAKLKLQRENECLTRMLCARM